MSLAKHTGQILALFLAGAGGSRILLAVWPGAVGLWLATALLIACAIAAWWFNRKLVIPNAVETPGVASAQTRVFWGVLGIAAIMLAELIGYWLEAALFKIGAPTITPLIAAGRSVPAYFIAAVVARPVLQELAFRKVIFGNLVGVTGVFGAALVSGLLGAVASDPQHWLAGTLAGLVYAYLYRQTGSISAPMIAHIGTLAIAVLYAIGH